MARPLCYWKCPGEILNEVNVGNGDSIWGFVFLRISRNLILTIDSVLVVSRIIINIHMKRLDA